MNMKIQLRALDFLNKMAKNNIEAISYAEYVPQKNITGEKRSVEPKLPRSKPEIQGVDSDYLAAFMKELQSFKGINPHAAMVLRNGTVIAEGAFYPYRLDIWHVSHSLCKTVTGIAIGMAIEEGILHLNDRLTDIFKARVNVIDAVLKKNILIKHLLTMSSGSAFNEVGIVTSKDWVKSFLESGTIFEPGAEFFYNSMNTYMLSAVIKEITGQGIVEYLTPRLWNPLGIEPPFWQKCPQGTEAGGWGLYLCPEDMAKLGQLMLQKGSWNGNQIISEKWIEKATHKHMDTPAKMSKYGYGYQLWISNRKDSYQLNGMLGQNIFVYPDVNMVVVITAGSEDLFPESAIMRVMEKYFGKKLALEHQKKDNLVQYMNLQHVQSQLCRKEHTGYTRRLLKFVRNRISNLQWERQYLQGKVYILDEVKIGLLPLFLQCIHTNFSKGMESIEFIIRKAVLFMKIAEGVDCHIIPLGFDRAVYFRLSSNKEKYQMACRARLTTNEDNISVLVVKLYFLEECNTRILKIYFNDEESITVKASETPGIEILLEGINATFGIGSLFANSVNSLAENKMIGYELKKIIEPSVIGKAKFVEISL